MKKFTKKYYRAGVNHIQVWIKENMFLEAKLHKDGTFDLLMTNPIFTKPKLGKKATVSEIMSEKSIAKIKSEYLSGFFLSIEEMSKAAYTKAAKK